MQDTDDASGSQQIDVSIQEDLLKRLELASVTTSGHWTSSSCLSRVLLHVFIDAGNETELPVLHVVESDAQWQRFNGRVQLRHVALELPERVEEDNRIVPSILSRDISGT